jgi:hypothetical protein
MELWKQDCRTLYAKWQIFLPIFPNIFFHKFQSLIYFITNFKKFELLVGYKDKQLVYINKRKQFVPEVILYIFIKGMKLRFFIHYNPTMGRKAYSYFKSIEENC